MIHKKAPVEHPSVYCACFLHALTKIKGSLFSMADLVDVFVFREMIQKSNSIIPEKHHRTVDDWRSVYGVFKLKLSDGMDMVPVIDAVGGGYLFEFPDHEPVPPEAFEDAKFVTEMMEKISFRRRGAPCKTK